MEDMPIPTASGSSPRVRGTSRHAVPEAELIRFIPACAGNIAAQAVNPVLVSVHPRVCGEHEALALRVQGDGGSSPRVRGTCPYSANNSANARFIPACAGNMLNGSV